MVNGFARVGLVACCALAAVPSEAAKRLEPPSLVLTAPENRVAAVEVAQIGDEDAVFVRLAELHGETPGEIRVRLGRMALERIEVGRRYLLGYTLLRRDRRRAPVFELDPAGPRIVQVPAVGEALFEDSPSVRKMIELVGTPGEMDEAALLGAIVSQAERPDTPTRLMVLVELVLRPELAESVGAAHMEAFRRLLEGGDLEPIATDCLLQALHPLARQGRAGWLRPVSVDLVRAHDRQLELASSVPAMLETSIRLLADVGEPEDAAVLVEHLYSNNPGVGRAAAWAMAALDPVLAKREAQRALEEGGIHPDVARALRRLSGEDEP